MDQNFQTSFIPKKPIVDKRSTSSNPIGLFMIISIFLFFAVVLGAGGAYFYKQVLVKDLISKQDDLSKAKNRFEPGRINILKKLDIRLNAAREVLLKHVAVSPIFEALETITLKTLRFTKFSYVLNGDKVDVKMNGQAIGYRSIALQADLLSKNKNFIDPVFSNLTLDNKGNVLFDLVFSVDRTFVDYKQMLETASSNTTDVIVPDASPVN